MAIVSESLGESVLSATAQVIRHRWPHARILIFGRNRPAIEDHLYDARIDDKARPEDLLAALVVLSKDTWNQHAQPSRLLTDGKAWLGSGNGMNYIAESDPTKRHANAVDRTYRRDLPGGEHRFRQAS